MIETLVELLDQPAETAVAAPLVEVFDGEWEQVGDFKYLSFRQKGLSFATDENGKIASIFLYSGTHESFCAYRGPVPRAISFTSARIDIRKTFGAPKSAGDGVIVPILGKSPPWDKYEFASYSLVIDYSEQQDSIALITLAALGDKRE